MAKKCFVEVALFDVDGQFYVEKIDDDPTEWYPTMEELMEGASFGYPCREIEEKDLPLPVEDHHYTDLHIFEVDGRNGKSYFAAIQY